MDLFQMTQICNRFTLLKGQNFAEKAFRDSVFLIQYYTINKIIVFGNVVIVSPRIYRNCKAPLKMLFVLTETRQLFMTHGDSCISEHSRSTHVA